MRVKEKVYKAIGCMLRESLTSFIKRGFQELNPGTKYLHNWHIEEIGNVLSDLYIGKKRRVIINMPPRYLKSICVSVCFPAWILGIDPKKRLIVASYSMDLSNKHSIDTRKLMQSNWYRENFPDTVIAKGENRKNKFVTTEGGFRLAASSGGSLTGEGGDFLILDDPHKPVTIASKLQRVKVIEWFENTFSSRLNDKKKGGMVIVMQRLHQEDLTGYLLSSKKNWDLIKLPAICQEKEVFRKPGEPLHAEREGIIELEAIKEEIGDNVFEAQYQQDPCGANNFFLPQWILYEEKYQPDCKDTIVISIDSASKTGVQNDFTAITYWNIKDNTMIMFNAIKARFDFGSLLQKTKEIISILKPRFVLIEDKSSGTQLLQELKSFCPSCVKLIGIKPKYEKLIRFINILIYFERGQIKLSKTIPILKDIEEELIAFPNSPHDDMVDSITMFLTWYSSFSIEIKRVAPQVRIL